jgi:hypothetical protein
MQKWEYKFIECISHLEEWYPAFENGEEIVHWKTGGNISTYSNTLGEQGWEMVNFTHQVTGSSSDSRESLRLVFKRPRT